MERAKQLGTFCNGFNLVTVELKSETMDAGE